MPSTIHNRSTALPGRATGSMASRGRNCWDHPAHRRRRHPEERSEQPQGGGEVDGDQQYPPLNQPASKRPTAEPPGPVPVPLTHHPQQPFELLRPQSSERLPHNASARNIPCIQGMPASRLSAARSCQRCDSVEAAEASRSALLVIRSLCPGGLPSAAYRPGGQTCRDVVSSVVAADAGVTATPTIAAEVSSIERGLARMSFLSL